MLSNIAFTAKNDDDEGRLKIRFKVVVWALLVEWSFIEAVAEEKEEEEEEERGDKMIWKQPNHEHHSIRTFIGNATIVGLFIVLRWSVGRSVGWLVGVIVGLHVADYLFM